MFAMMRGFGVQLWPVLQDLGQLTTLYPKRWESFIANAGVVQAFAPGDLKTAEWMSRRAGDTTVAVTSFNRGDGQTSAGQGSVSQNSGFGYGQVRRPLFLPQELMDFGKGTGLLWAAGSSRSIPFQAKFYKELPLAYLADPNPYFPNANAA
jgi:type IV secretion system protein VirD4